MVFVHIALEVKDPMLATRARVACASGGCTVLTSTSAQAETRVLERDGWSFTRQSQIADPIGPCKVLSMLEHQGNSSPAHGGGNPGQTRLHPLSPAELPSQPPLSVGGGSPGHRDPRCAAERGGPGVLTTVCAPAALSSHSRIFKSCG